MSKNFLYLKLGAIMGGPGAGMVPLVGGPVSMSGVGGIVGGSVPVGGSATAVVGVPRPLSPGLNYGER